MLLQISVSHNVKKGWVFYALPLNVDIVTPLHPFHLAMPQEDMCTAYLNMNRINIC